MIFQQRLHALNSADADLAFCSGVWLGLAIIVPTAVFHGTECT